jgi:Flagellar transcriptional activator (FlhC)
MHISNERYFHERQRHDLALRMIRHEARTCTIRSCTGLTDDRIRRLYKTYASHMPSVPVRRRRGKSPRQVGFFVRNARAQLESSMLASVFAAFGLWRAQSNAHLGSIPSASIEFGRLFCDAYETHRQLLRNADISFEHAWFLLQLLSRNADLHAVRCRHCDSQYLRDRVNVCRRTCPVCALNGPGSERG